MNRQEFMIQLNQLLLDVPEEERKEALEFYENYFDDAGANQEEQIINELGTPERIAKIIKSDLMTSGDYSKSGEYTESGYSNTDVEKDSIIKVNSDSKQSSHQHNENYNKQEQNNDSTSHQEPNVQVKTKVNIPLLILICIFAIPVIFPVFLGILGTVLGLILGFGAAAIGCFIGGVASIVLGIMKLFLTPAFGCLAVSAGFICLGLGLLFFMLFWSMVKLVRAIIRWMTSLFHLPLKTRRMAV